MITALIKYGNNSLLTEFPVEAMRLYNQLSSIGIADRADKIPALGNNSISVKLFAGELLGLKRAVGQSLINRLTPADTLRDVNVASYWLQEACAKDHEAFAALIAKASPSSLTDLRDLTEGFYGRPISKEIESPGYDEDQDMDEDDELEP
ncbi:hypothetical protein [Desulfosporosinus lacus]|uniref:Uncharacterized protein n=1 Tax=Desulfosporosinus lacus DSM 15449 TaxID=1121420 RepID=A0A1M5V0I1_9FIRM|nr:hypothetical protein [Desulfosporosinus lacus]SHH68686.1 hypothetical protein SAMN02746098_01145 [Desulfosporosinus lacus DSM 15449]